MPAASGEEPGKRWAPALCCSFTSPMIVSLAKETVLFMLWNCKEAYETMINQQPAPLQ